MNDRAESEWVFDRAAIAGFHKAHHREQLALAVAGGLLTSTEARALAEQFAQSETLQNIVDAEISMLTEMVESRVH